MSISGRKGWRQERGKEEVGGEGGGGVRKDSCAGESGYIGTSCQLVSALLDQSVSTEIENLPGDAQHRRLTGKCHSDLLYMYVNKLQVERYLC
jgi:hypothetical protein